MPRLHSTLLKAAGLLLALTTTAAAQDYPTKPVRLIIPFPPGGSNDVVGRLIATASRREARQAGRRRQPRRRRRRRGRHRASPRRRPKDGYTLLIISLAHAVNPGSTSSPTIRSRRSRRSPFSPPARTCWWSIPTLPVNSVKDLIALAKEKPGQLQYASAGVGSFQHLGGELFKLTAGVNLLHVPFKGGGPAMIDVIGGHTKIMFSSLVQTTPHIRSGKLQALGIGGADAQSGIAGRADHRGSRRARLRGRQLVGRGGARRHAARHRREAAQGDCTEVQTSPEVQKQFSAEGASIVQMSTAEFAAFIEKEMTKWQRVVKEGGIKAE